MNALLSSRLSKVRLVVKPCLALFIIFISVLSPASSRQTPDGEILTREGDESAITVEEREHALATLLTAAGQLRSAGDLLKAARYLNRAGRLQLQLNLPHDALNTYQNALSLLEQSPEPATNVDSLNGSGAAHSSLSECDQAQPLFRQAISLSEQSGYIAGKAEALLKLSTCQNYGDHALALRTAQESLALWQSINHKWGIAESSAAIGQYQLTLSNVTEAAKSYETALSLWRELKLSNEQAEALISLGFIEYRKGAWQNSFSFYAQAQDLLDEKAEPYKMGQIASGLAEAFIESGMLEAGLTKLQQALGYYRQTQNPRAVLAVSWDIGKASYLAGDYPAALATLQAALKDGEAIKESAMTAMCHEYLGRTFAAMNDREAAERHFVAAIDLYLKVGDQMEAARTRALMGQLYQQEGQVDKARTYFKSALATFRTLTDHLNESATLYALGNLELAQNNLDLAADYLKQSIDTTENIRRISKSSDLTAAFSATVYERYEKYIECLMRQGAARPAQDRSVRAFETSELARGRSLAELLRATGTIFGPGLDPQLAEQEKSLRQALRVKEDARINLLSTAYQKEELDALEAEQARLDEEYKKLTDSIRARYPAYAEISQPTGWDLRRIQEEVIGDDQTVLLEYSLGTSQSYVWAVTRDSVTSHALPAGPVINDAAQKVYRLLQAMPEEGPEGELSAATQELGRLVLAPVSARLDRRRIIVVADGALNYIPFQILPSAGNEPLVAGYEVVNVPSASILGELRREAAHRQPASKVLAAFGDPVFASNYAQRKDTGVGEQVASAQTPAAERWRHSLRDIELKADSFDPSTIGQLEYAKRELTNLRDVAGDGNAFIAADFAATRAQLLQTDLSHYAILHFATHGFLDPVHPEKSGLVLSTVNREGQAQDGFIGLKDIYELRAPVELVVLSACQTALGKDVRGEGLIGLTRGFMYAGASTVVASLWKVDDEATAELMKHFYANMLQKKMTPSAALREAQNSIRQKTEWNSPHYWAAFTLQGEYREVIKPAQASGEASSSRVLLGGIALMTLIAGLAGVAWAYRHRQVKVRRDGE